MPKLVAGDNITLTEDANHSILTIASSGGIGTVTSLSVVSANGVSGSVANPTTTPAITFSLGAITPTSILSSGTVLGSNLSGTNTGDQDISVFLLKASNLSDLTSAPSARTNLGLGTLATQSGTFSGTSSGTNTGDQTITLTGGVTGSGTGTFAATVATNANLTGPITSTGNATAIASQTGTGSKFVVDDTPTLITPVLGVATATSINKVAFTAPAASATLTIANTKTLTVNGDTTLTNGTHSGTNTGDQVGDGVTITGAGTIGSPFVAVTSGTGDVVGPASAGDSKVVLFNGTTGKLIKDSGLTLSGSNTGDQTLPVKASGAELDTGTDDAKFSTAKALKDSHNVPSVAPSTSGNVMTSNGTDWTSAAATSTNQTDVVIITATGATNWAKPSGFNASALVIVELWGGGGSGGVGAANAGGAGGGGGAYVRAIFKLGNLTDPVAVTVGGGGAAVGAGSAGGNVGGNTTFGAYATAYGGGGGGYNASGGGGGGGGGAFSVGTTVGNANNSGAGGSPMGGASVGSGTAGVDSAFGGASGGGGSAGPGGNSGYGGGGGGACLDGSGVATTNKGGDSIMGGGGGGGGANSVVGGNGGVSYGGGAGGAGAIDTNTSTAGSQPGGGSGGAEAGASAKGGDGMARITTIDV